MLATVPAHREACLVPLGAGNRGALRGVCVCVCATSRPVDCNLGVAKCGAVGVPLPAKSHLGSVQLPLTGTSVTEHSAEARGVPFPGCRLFAHLWLPCVCHSGLRKPGGCRVLFPSRRGRGTPDGFQGPQKAASAPGPQAPPQTWQLAARQTLLVLQSPGSSALPRAGGASSFSLCCGLCPALL